MYVHVEADSIRIEVRCGKCDSVMHILDQYEYNDTVTVDVSPCDECEEEDESRN